MADPLNEAMLTGSLDDHSQVTVVNGSGAEYAPNEVIFIENDSGIQVPYVVRATIANGSSGQANMFGEFSFAANSTAVFAVGDEIYWHVSANEAVERSQAKTGDYYLAKCTKAKASGASFVWGRLGENVSVADVISTSSSISVSTSTSSTSSSSVCSSSVSSSNSSSSSESKTSKSVSSLSNSSSTSVSKSSNSNSSSSTSNSISSNSDSSTSSESSEST